jgi:hypothetical protein
MLSVIIVESVMRTHDKGKRLCIHHWRIDTSGAEKVNGTCLKCGARKQFHNYIFGSANDEKVRNDMQVRKAKRCDTLSLPV